MPLRDANCEDVNVFVFCYRQVLLVGMVQIYVFLPIPASKLCFCFVFFADKAWGGIFVATNCRKRVFSLSVAWFC